MKVMIVPAKRTKRNVLRLPLFCLRLLEFELPTSALDADNRKSFINLLFQECEKEGSALVLVSHDAALGSMFDRTVELGGAA